jgi:hypothetical protein
MKVFNLNNENKDEINNLVLDKISLVRYYSENCGHCVAMKDEWSKLEDTMNNRQNDNMIVVSIEGDNIKYFEHFKDIQGYPTIIKLIHGKKDKEYNGDRSFNDMLKFVNENFNQFQHQRGGKKKINKKSKKIVKKNNKRKSKKFIKKHNKKSRKSKRV